MTTAPGRRISSTVIYLKEALNLAPASPETRDQFIDFANADLLPAYARIGARLVGAWFGNSEWYGQVTHMLEFDDLHAFAAFRETARADTQWAKCEAQIAQFAPERTAQLLEPLGPIGADVLHEAIRASRAQPINAYSLAVLEVAPGKMAELMAGIEAIKSTFPIIASWRAVAGNPNEIVDLWKGALGQEPYQPADERMKAFFRPLRLMAPRERLVNLYTLPYSPLR